MLRYQSTKTYGHEVGLSVAFRQWRAKSHCRHIHGYALSITTTFEADQLDPNNWVVDFGGLKDFKQELVNLFDHKLLVAEDDPMIDKLAKLVLVDVADVVIVPSTGCESFAALVYGKAFEWLRQNEHRPRVRVRSVEVREHGANSAIYNG